MPIFKNTWILFTKGIYTVAIPEKKAGVIQTFLSLTFFLIGLAIAVLAINISSEEWSQPMNALFIIAMVLLGFGVISFLLTLKLGYVYYVKNIGKPSKPEIGISSKDVQDSIQRTEIILQAFLTNAGITNSNINNLITEIRQERNERKNNPKQSHL